MFSQFFFEILVKPHQYFPKKDTSYSRVEYSRYNIYFYGFVSYFLGGSVSSAIATYVPTQKPEWKRYKQYTRHDIDSAIEAVQNGMSALQASRKFGVPSRTLYDKVKKRGIVTSRPFRRSSSGNNGAAFPYGISGASLMLAGNEQNHMSMERMYLHHADVGDSRSADNDREAVAIAAAAGASINSDRNSTTPPNSHPSPRSPSPNLIKYANRNSMTPSPPPMQEGEDEEDQVEDLSISRKPDPPPTSRVIMPPMSQATATMLAAGSDSMPSDGVRD